MNRATFNISMPETMKKFVNKRAGGGRYGSVSEYIRELIRHDQNRLRRTSQLERQHSDQRFAASPFDNRIDRNG